MEVEELPAQTVTPRGSPRLGMRGLIAVGAIVVLLAAGFGVLGGRPDATPVATRGGVGPTVAETRTAPAVEPRVTPWARCNASPDDAPEAVLQVNGRPYIGRLEVMELSGPAPSDLPDPISSNAAPDVIEVPTDVTNEIWVVGGACAVAWEIDLDYLGGWLLDRFINPDRDPSYGAQNRFLLPFDPLFGGEHDLRAVLTFPEITIRVTWRIRLIEVVPPVPTLAHGRRSVVPVSGCDVTLTLPNLEHYQLNPCVDDVAEGPIDALVVGPGDELRFTLGDWLIGGSQAICGGLSGESFIAQPRPACLVDGVSGEPLTFKAPDRGGRWTVALSACASPAAAETLRLDVPSVCGTWFANVTVRG